MKKIKFIIAVILFSISNINSQWIQVSGGEITSLAVNDSIVFAGTYFGGIIRSTNNGLTWDYANNGLTNKAIYDFGITDNSTFVGTQNGIYHSTNDGETWMYNSFAGKTISVLETYYNKVFLAYYSSGNPYIYFSSNNGTNWQSMNASYLRGLYPTSFAFNSDKIYAGFSNGGMFLSLDGGSSWFCYSNGLPNYGAVKHLRYSNSILFAGTGLGMFRTMDDGNYWEPINNGITDFQIQGISEYDSNLFISTYGGGVCMTTNNGNSWTNINEGLTNFYLSRIVNNGTYLFIGTKGDGVWRRPLTEVITEVNDPNPIIERFVLEQNYPNPFNPSTKISWQSPVGSWQTLKVYDVLGNEVATLVNEYRSAGSYEIEFNASNLPTGVYFYQLKAGNFVQTKKMILIK